MNITIIVDIKIPIFTMNHYHTLIIISYEVIIVCLWVGENKLWESSNTENIFASLSDLVRFSLKSSLLACY